MSLRLLILPALLAFGCAAQGASGAPEAAGWAPVAGMSRVTVQGVPRTYAELLGLDRDAIEQAIAPTGTDDEWVEYGDHLRIAYRDGKAVRLRARTPQEFGCLEGARWMGFAQPRRPIVDEVRCHWPGARLHDRLAKGYGGEYRRDLQWFWIWQVEDEEDARERLEPGHR